MKVKEKKWIRFRVYLVAVFFLLGLGTVLARAYQLQVLNKDRLAVIAQEGYVGTIKLPPKRGTIYEREGNELALSIEVGSVYAHPRQIEEKNNTAKQLSRVLGEKQQKILKLIKKNRSFVWIKRRIEPGQAKKVSALELKGVGVTTETKRYYPGKEIAAHLIGFVGAENQGLEGLERKYEKLLIGSQYSLIQMRDALGRLFSISRPIPSGHEMRGLVLTIDKDIQYKAQQALQRAVRKTKARAGHCLVVNPETGEILATAVVPEFNPNIFSKYRPYQWRNRAITDCYEPGSTMKAFLLSACLEESVVTPSTKFDCEQGKYKIGARTVRDTHKYGVLTVSDIIVRSSNIGAIKIGEKLGYARLYEYVKKFGFGRKTGVALLGERKGFVRSPKKARQIDRATLCFGQGMTTTSLQLVMAMAAIANGGKLMRPYVVKAVVDESGRVIKETYPKVVRRVISSRTAKKVAGILEGVVSKEGTGPLAAIKGFKVAGKTGTAQKVDPKTKTYSRTKDVATFVGFAPADRPKLVILVMIDEPKGIPYGGVVAGPVFSEVGLWSLNHLRINPQIKLVDKGTDVEEETDKSSKPEPLKDEQPPVKVEAGFLPDFSGLGMREVLKKGRSLGLKVVLKGTGLAVRQEPGPGSPLKMISSIKVSFRPPT
ncbi:MAG: transpeptidase family protein [Deltaproteobacteria bacterium]|nr:transpeptidase family protein [Deltaproteobacteria bacterium]MBW2117652.1 transpeptidase family protein [Deltaproteobacteria bacterium]